MAFVFQAIGYPELGYDKKPTFYGVLRNCFTRINVQGTNTGLSRKWNENTTVKYARDYSERLFPIMSGLFGKDKPMHSYTAEDFEVVLDELRKKYNYAASSMLHYRYLLWIVYQSGFEDGLYDDNIFWGEVIDPEENPKEYEKHRANALTRIRKSFSISEDIRLMRFFMNLDPLMAEGENIALACMYFSGIRNNEACGADFSDFHVLDIYPDTAVFDMVRTTTANSNITKPSGKTKNAPRTLPIPKWFYNFIVRRRTWIQQQIDDGAFSLPKGINSVDNLPVACVGHDYAKRAQSGDLSRAGRALFRAVGIEKSELAILQEILFSQEFRETEIEEKDPTTYLFRRNVATRLYHMGFPWTTIQYWVAHEIEDSVIARNHFVDEDILHELGVRYFMHPVFHILEDSAAKNRMDYQTDFSIDPSRALLVQATTLEPNQSIKVWLQGDGTAFDIKVKERPHNKQETEDVDILNALYHAYRERLRNE